MTDNLNTWPETIYLQHGDDGEPVPDFTAMSGNEASWCQDRIHDSDIAYVRADLTPKPEWIVNDLGELGVKIGDRFFFLYKGDNIEYTSGLHDDGTPMKWRQVGKREFGETCWPQHWVRRGYREDRYTQELVYHPGLSDGKPGDADWRDLPRPAEPS